MEEKRIKISHVLHEIDQVEQGGQLHYFSLHYSKVNGKKGYKGRVRKAGTFLSLTNAVSTSKFKYNVKENGVLLLVDDTNNQTFSLKICLLTHYNGIRIQH